MAKEKTPIERPKKPVKPFKGVESGKSFTTDNQPTPEQKKAGWQELRKRRLLTQEIIKMMLNEDGTPKATFKDYMNSLVKNAANGNPKAIDTINKAIEDEIIKVAQTNSEGEDVEPVYIFNSNGVPPVKE